jgi:AcrR family transcriptional regulator
MLSADEVARHQRDRILRAMIELVDERGYEAVKVSDVARRAHVSTATFYKLFGSKLECLLGTHDRIMRVAADRIAASIRAAREGDDRLEVALHSLASLLASRPAEARFACLGVRAAGLGMLEHDHYAASCFAALLAECLPTDAGHRPPPTVIVEGMVAGLAHVVRSRLIDGRESEIDACIPALHGWILGLCAPEAHDLHHLTTSTGSSAREPAPQLLLGVSAPVDPDLDLHDLERIQILGATLSLAAEAGYWQLSAPRIRMAAGVSRRCFDRQFDGPDDCFVAALELLAERVMDYVVAEASALGAEWARGFHLALASLCERTAADPAAARLALVEVLAAGPRGLRDLCSLIDLTAARLQRSLPRRQRPEPVAAQASMGALWGLVHRRAATRRFEELPDLVPDLSFLALVPVVGSSAALAAIDAEPSASAEALAAGSSWS